MSGTERGRRGQRQRSRQDRSAGKTVQLQAAGVSATRSSILASTTSGLSGIDADLADQRTRQVDDLTIIDAALLLGFERVEAPFEL
jgi:hypothetical protein